MSWICGTTELVSGGWLSSAYPGLGATGAQIKAATAGGSGVAPGPLYNDSLADASEYYWRVHTPPASGTLVPYEIGGFDLTGAADGSWPWTYDIWEDGTKLVGLQPDGSTLVTTLVGVVLAGVSVSVAATVTHGGTYSAAASVGAAGVGAAVSVAATVTHGGTYSASVVPVVTGGALSDGEMRQLFAWVQDLARIHGLVMGTPLVVTPTLRQAGPINQSISEAGSTVTVTRV